jgi:thiol-disulfide isomerase/thioredoxin
LPSGAPHPLANPAARQRAAAPKTATPGSFSGFADSGRLALLDVRALGPAGARSRHARPRPLARGRCTRRRPAAADLPPLGTAVDDLSFVDIRAQRRCLSELGQPRALVLFFVTKDCPMVLRLFPKVGALAREYGAHGVQFVAVNVSRADTVRDLGTQAITYEQPYPFVRDEDGRFLRTLGVERTTSAVVLDREPRLRYRGRIDDQVRYANVKDAPTCGSRSTPCWRSNRSKSARRPSKAAK